MKSCRPSPQKLSCRPYIKTVMLLGNFKVGLIIFFNLSTNFLFKFFNFFIFSIKNAFSTFLFILWVNVFTSMDSTSIETVSRLSRIGLHVKSMY